MILTITPCWGDPTQDQPSAASSFDSLVTRITQDLTSDPARALAQAEQGLADAQAHGIPAEEVTMLTLLQEIYFRKGAYAQSVEFGLKSIEVNKAKVHDDIALAYTYRNLGNTYNFGLKQYNEALNYHTIALKVFESRKDQKMIAAQLGGISWIYGITGKDLEKGLELAQKGVQLSREVNDKQLLAYNYNSKGILFTKMELYDSAIVMLLKSIDYGNQVNDRAVVSYNKVLLGEAYAQQENYISAFRYFQEAAKESINLNVREVEKDAYYGLSRYYEAIGDTDQALDYLQRYAALKDTLLNREVTEKAIFYEHLLEKEHQQSVITQLEFDNQRAQKEKQFIILLMVMGALLFGLVLFFVTKNNHQRKAANRLLQEKNNAILRQNKKLEELNGTKDKLFSIIGHDMRSPIGNLSAILELMRKNVMQPDEMQHVLLQLNQSVGGLHEMLESLLEWSRSQMQGFQLEPVTLNMKAIADKTLSFYQTAAQDKSIRLTNHIPEGLYAVADKNHVLLTLRNLVNNAIKFTHANGDIELHGRAVDKRIEISVKDNGIGIEAVHLDKLFRFEQGISMRGTNGEKGTGFGLALCKEMVEANQGRITVSTELDKGSTFTFTLPAAV